MRLNSLSQIWYAISVKDLVPLTFQLEECKNQKLSAFHFLLLLLTHPLQIRKTSIIIIDIARTKNNTINEILLAKHGTPCFLRWCYLKHFNAAWHKTCRKHLPFDGRVVGQGAILEHLRSFGTWNSHCSSATGLWCVLHYIRCDWHSLPTITFRL